MSLRVPARLHSQSLIAIHAFLTRQRLGRSLVRGAAIALLCLGAAGASAATYTVANLNDSGADSLRAAISSVDADSSADTINFSVTGTITLHSALPAITNSVTITGPGANLLTVSGGGSYQVFNIGSGVTVSISGLTIASGNTTGNGGGIANGGTLTVSDCNFTNDAAASIQSSKGGAIYSSGSLTVVDSTFSSNNADSRGGGIYSGGSLTVTNSTFSGGSAGAYGGAISVGSGTGTVTDSTFYENSVSSGGGAIENLATLTVTDSTFFNNYASYYAGAVYSQGTLTADDNIFSQNSANLLGGGIYKHSGTVTAEYNVFYNNLAGGSEDDCNGCTSTNSSFGVNPKLLPLGYYGGMTETMALGPGSAAICAGLGSDALSAGVTADQRGFGFDRTCPSGYWDAGAVQTNQAVVTTLNDQADNFSECIHGTGNSCSLRDAIGAANEFFAINGTGADITFLPSLTSISSPGTIKLGAGSAGDSGLPAITGTVNIIGPGANQLTVSGNNDFNLNSVITVDSGATVTLYGLTIANGNSIGGPGGGGINNAGALTVMASAVSSNYTGLQGGGVFNNGKLAVTDSTVSGNTASFGGGIASWGTLTVTESTFSGNTANGVDGTTAEGGGIYNLGTVTLSNSTVSGNSATCSDCYANGGGVSLFAGTLTASNSIVAGNSASSTGGYIAQYADITGSYTDNGGNLANSNISATSPYQAAVLLSALLYNGIGATVQTMIPLPGSPVICAGETSNIPSGTTTDERGYPLQPSGGYCSSTNVDAGAVQTNYTGVQWVQQPPATTYALSGISPAPTVEVLETDTLLSSNNTDAVNGVPITIAFNGPGALNGTLSETTSGGVATYGDLSPTDAAMNDSLQTDAITVTSGVTLPAVPSNSFDAIGDVSQFIVSAPATAVAGTPFNVTVTAEDAAGNTVTSFTGLFTVSSSDGSIVESPLAGFVAVTNGVGTFQATLHVAGSQTISARELVFPNYSGTSGTIAVSAASPAILTASAGTPQLANVNVAFATALTATVTDPYGNPISGATVNFTAPGSGASAALSSAGSCVTASNGSCSVTAMANGTAGSYNVTAAVSGLTSVNFALTNNALPSFVVTTLTDKTDGSPDCSSGTGNTCSLRDAMTMANAAGAGNITFLASLTSVASPGTINLGSSASPAGTGTPLPALAGTINITGPGANQLTVSGNNDINVGGVFMVNSGATAIIYGLTIANGNKGNGPEGGDIYDLGGTLTVTASTISGGQAPNGGGIAGYGILTVIGSTISGNTATPGGGSSGSAGGGIAFGGTLTLTQSTVSGNFLIADYTGGFGAGIASYGTSTLTGSTISGNLASCFGGCSTILGGGIYIGGGTLTATESTVSGNSASGGSGVGTGGGIYNNGMLTLTAITVSGNSAAGSGGGILNGPSGAMTVFNNIVAVNTAPTAPDFSSAAIVSEQHNVIGSGAGSTFVNGINGDQVGGGPPPLNPQLSLLQLNGVGATVKTLIPLPGSPAICAGSASLIPSGTTTDERGYPLQPTNGYCPSGSIDAGAVQTNYTSVAFVQQPTNVDFPAAISPSPTVEILETDALLTSDNTDAVNGVPLTLTYSNGSGDISGSLTQTTASGVATFTNLTPQTTGDDFSFTASVPVTSAGSGTTLMVTSNPFDVIAPGNLMNFSPSPPPEATAGNTYSYQLSATGGAGPYTYSATGLAAGLQVLNSQIAGQCTNAVDQRLPDCERQRDASADCYCRAVLDHLQRAAYDYHHLVAVRFCQCSLQHYDHRDRRQRAANRLDSQPLGCRILDRSHQRHTERHGHFYGEPAVQYHVHGYVGRNRQQAAHARRQ